MGPGLPHHMIPLVTVTAQLNSSMHGASTAKACWDWVHSEFTTKSVYTQNDLESLFHKMQCTKGGNAVSSSPALLRFHRTSDHYHFFLSYLPISQSPFPYHKQIPSDCLIPSIISLITPISDRPWYYLVASCLSPYQ